MSTNYYAVKKKPSIHNRVIHLGKYRSGWLFMFREHEDIHTFPQFCNWLKNNVDTGEYIILDEYDREFSKELLLMLIEDTQNDPYCRNNPDNFSSGNKNVDGYIFIDREFC